MVFGGGVVSIPAPWVSVCVSVCVCVCVCVREREIKQERESERLPQYTHNHVMDNSGLVLVTQ